MRYSATAFLLCLSAPAAAQQSVTLDPFASGFTFAPEAPSAVDSQHPLYGRVMVDAVQDMPSRIGSAFTPVTGAKEFNTAIQKAFASANMLASADSQAKARLRVSWRSFELPFKIGLSSRASVRVLYELSRIDNGQVIFAREIETEASARGGQAYLRARGTGRAAIQANLASAILCLSKAAFGQAPENCALAPVGQFSAPITVPIYR